jgi:hypothetical protein
MTSKSVKTTPSPQVAWRYSVKAHEVSGAAAASRRQSESMRVEGAPSDGNLA